MTIKFLTDEDFLQYKKPSMFIGFPKCTFKCSAELCQNSALANSPNIEIDGHKIVERYINNPITEAIVFGGLDPFDTKEDVFNLISLIREKTNDDIVIYTGYTEEECSKWIMDYIKNIPNIIIKYGRYVPNKELHFDEVLGVKLASPNQYAVKYNDFKS